MISKYTKDIEKHITPHKLRATCATNLYKKTGDIYMVADQLGHANIATSKIYTEIDNESKLKAANILDNLIHIPLDTLHTCFAVLYFFRIF